MDTSIKPQLYYFNPGHEGAILTSSPYYTPPSNIVNLQYDLSYLPAWYANAKDFILVESELPLDFQAYLSTNLAPLPKGIIADKMNRSLTEVHLWGISPQSIHHIEKINSKYHLHFNLPQWKDELRTLSSRENAKECLKFLCDEIPSISTDIIPNFYTNLADIENVVEKSDHQLLAKAPYSSSGRGLLWLPVDGLTQTERQILQGILNKQKTVSIEKVLNKKIDFAMEFILENNHIRFEGYSLFKTNAKGGYLGNYIGSQENIVNCISKFIDNQLLDSIIDRLSVILKNMFKGIYSGCIGVDMMIYEDENSTYKLHPCIEINVRDNMGLLALRFSEKHLEVGSEGSFYIDFSSQEGEQLDRDQNMKKEYPASFSNGKIKSGYLSLCPVTEKTKYRAYVLVE